MKKKSAAIIGAGIGGLAASIRLANEGFNVTVFEQNSNPGGKANQINEEGFRFDTGPSLLTMPFILKKLFQDSQENINEYLTIEPLKIICKYFYPDGTIINAFSDKNKFASELEEKTNDKKSSLFNYLNYSKKIYDLTSDLFLFNNFRGISSLINIKSFKTLFSISKIDPFRTMHGSISKFFNDEKTIQLFDRYATYNGSNPYKAPATLNIISHVEYNIGGFIVKEGIYSIPDSLYKISCKKGVQFKFKKQVKNILLNNSEVAGIQYLDDNREVTSEKFDIIISNSDVNFTYQNLLEDNFSKDSFRYQNLEYSSSALVFYWGVKGNFPQLEYHNILFSRNYKNEFEEIFEHKICPSDPTIYIYISSKFKKDDAPEGYENWFVMINTPSNENQNWEEEIKNAKQRVIRKINDVLKINLEDLITFERILNSLDLEKNFNSYKGSIYGTSSNSRSAAFLRQSNRSKKYKGLYFCGGSAHPGGGIPLVLLSAEIAVKEILKHELN